MEWSVIASYIEPDLFIVIGVCWIIGYVLRRTPRVPNWTIIYAVTLAAIIISSYIMSFNVESVMQGILCGALAVYGNEFIKQTRRGLVHNADTDSGEK
ncbi:phage holin family protein [Paenibacillus sp. NPDC056722]|uniref:phage holin family protein n=1 Tax=Paenibacillus sp. NPDC056722 TaxID=3345924 RepID=UPI0036C78788